MKQFIEQVFELEHYKKFDPNSLSDQVSLLNIITEISQYNKNTNSISLYQKNVIEKIKFSYTQIDKLTNLFEINQQKIYLHKFNKISETNSLIKEMFDDLPKIKSYLQPTKWFKFIIYFNRLSIHEKETPNIEEFLQNETNESFYLLYEQFKNNQITDFLLVYDYFSYFLKQKTLTIDKNIFLNFLNEAHEKNHNSFNQYFINKFNFTILICSYLRLEEKKELINKTSNINTVFRVNGSTLNYIFRRDDVYFNSEFKIEMFNSIEFPFSNSGQNHLSNNKTELFFSLLPKKSKFEITSYFVKLLHCDYEDGKKFINFILQDENIKSLLDNNSKKDLNGVDLIFYNLAKINKKSNNNLLEYNYLFNIKEKETISNLLNKDDLEKKKKINKI